ncbi:MAG: domain S-box protein, partial [Acidimicrobiia bacterium]|nr:domain S-box protein [Acidimicrobiia bacterium]
TGQPCEAEFRLRRFDGQYRWFLGSGLAVTFDDQRQGLVGCCIDVNERQEGERERTRLVEMLGAAVSQASRLQRLTAGLARLVDAQEIASYVIEVGIEALGGNTGSLWLLASPDQLQLTAARGYANELVAQWSTFPLSGPGPATAAIRSARPIFIESPAQRDQQFPGYAAASGNASAAYASVPLIPVASNPMGAIVIGFPEPRTFGADDVALLNTFADQCAIALERARLYREAEQASDRWAFLAEASNALGSSLELETLLANLVDVIVPRVADWAAVHLVDNERFRSVHAQHRSPERTARFRQMLERYPPRADGPIGPGAVLRSGRSSIYPRLGQVHLEGLARDAEHLLALEEIGFGSAAYLPLMASDRVRGVLVLGRDRGIDLSVDDVLLAEQVASRASAALHNALLYRERSEIARALQASLLPPSLPPIAGLDLAARYSPAGSGAEVGGDFYDVQHIETHRWLAAIGDVCGTGIEAAALTGLARHALQSAALERRPPSAILAMANEVLLRAHRQPDGLVPDHRRFCTAVAMHLEASAAGFELTVCCAGHPQPVLVDAAGRTRLIGVEGTLLGVFSEVRLTDVTVSLAPGDTVVAFTDGVTERRRGSEFFDVPGIEQVLRQHLGSTADEIAGALEDAVAAFSDRALSDDMALLVIKVL